MLLVAKASSLIPIQAYNSIIMDIEILFCLDIAVDIAVTRLGPRLVMIVVRR